QQLKVFDRLPADARNVTIHENFIRPAAVEMPRDPDRVRAWWPGQAERWRRELSEKVFRGWPASPPALDVKSAVDVRHEGLRLRAFDFVSEEEVPLRLWLLTAEKTERPKLVVLTAVDEAGWQEWTRELGPAFQKALQLPAALALD